MSREPESGVEIWRVKDFEAIELHRGADVTVQFPRHWHDEIYFCAILKGAAYLDGRGASTLTPSGTLSMLPSGEVHANRKINCSFRCIFIEPEALRNSLEGFVERVNPGLNFHTTVIEDARTTNSFLRMHRSLETSDSRLKRDHSMLAFLHRLLARHSTAGVRYARCGEEKSAVQRAKNFLDEHYSESVSLHELARLTALSPYHLNRAFSRKVGMPPHSYQLHVRVARAKAALRAGLSIAQVALATGFADQSHFTRVFRRVAGRTPARYW